MSEVRRQSCALNCTHPPESGSPTYVAPTDVQLIATDLDFHVYSSRISDLIQNSSSVATMRAHQADMTHFRRLGGQIPATPTFLCIYIALLTETHRPATIYRRLASIGKAHRLEGHPDPTKSEIVRATLRGVRRTLGVAQQQAKPLLKDDLYEILSVMGGRPKDFRDRALLLLGFAGGFRRSELVNLNRNDVECVRQGIIVTLRRSKTDQDGGGRRIGIPFARGPWCPIRALDEWQSVAGPEFQQLFCVIDKHGALFNKRLSGEAVSLIIKARLKDAGRNPLGYSGHSLRAGFATSAAIAGAPAHKIRQQTGHASDAMMYRYIREGDLFINNATASVL